MDEQDLDLEFDDAGMKPAPEEDTGIFYWALKRALERTPMEPPPMPLR